ncbi:ComF family protein [Pseudoalteromonas sp. MMG012]|uniref:ComF family protein n=1 Tax=Pseudoalteromonas sp. MMG012 TaxID=2822686 RepID=UPI001B39DF9B|nr:ComF family protein [Pseudoalteromonas sp. MMG012]MBQ4850473.1 ComF family protein [Pseudoalteromonas sp. MMG012]
MALRKIIDWLMPNICICCHAPLATHDVICPYCLADMPLFAHSEGNLLLRPDIQRDFALPNCSGLIACGWYKSQLKVWLKGYKFQHKAYYKKALQQVITQQFSGCLSHAAFAPDLTIVIPLHPIRLATRGFNQVSQTWQPCLLNTVTPIPTLVRSHNTQAQSNLSRHKRQHNIKGAFYVEGSMEGLNVALVDDIITSGATMNAAARACLEAGAAQVWAFTTALTPLNR